MGSTVVQTMSFREIIVIHVLPSFLAMCGVIVASWLNNRHWNKKQLKATEDLHVVMNDKMDKALTSERSSGKAEGVLQEKERQEK
jgi:hypothetical protein